MQLSIHLGKRGVRPTVYKAMDEKERKAKQFTVQKLREAKVIVLKSVQRGKYFRIVADVFLDGVSLSNQLLDNKLAVTYSSGSKKHDWCNIKSIKS